MNIIKAKDYEAASRIAATLIAAQIQAKPDSVIGLATGSTPIGTYDELTKMYECGDLDFSQITTINLDEYRGLSGDHDQSYRYFMNEHLFNRVNVRKDHTYVPNGLEKDADKACSDYDKIIKDNGGIDLQLLGLGPDGHIGFNEPSDHFSKGTNCQNLTDSTITANARFFAKKEDVPTQAYTMGCGTIMDAKAVVLLATGKNKAEIVKEAFLGPVTPQVPASLLQFHKNATIICDADAASLI